MPSKIIPVIMCGGAGTRLWPVSRESMPKQFVPLGGNESMEEVIAEGEYYGMQTFDQSLFALYKNGLVSLRDAVAVASHPHDFRIALQQAGLSTTF